MILPGCGLEPRAGATGRGEAALLETTLSGDREMEELVLWVFLFSFGARVGLGGVGVQERGNSRVGQAMGSHGHCGWMDGSKDG